MKKSSRWFQKTLFAIYLLAIVWTSYTHAAEYKAGQKAIPSPFTPAKVIALSTPRGPWAVRAYVQNAARTSGVNPRIAEWIVAHESRHHPEATGDGGESRGLWQINKEWHPEVSDACAYNVRCSTDWSLERIRDGYADEWSTWKYCREKFEDCPF
ncbi:MAG: transglycosylase SLT domain-containing protein [Acidobacteriia bacterium]|nr:transglycosylase SLT domain-containing protein [Terriglobia bacterium]